MITIVKYVAAQAASLLDDPSRSFATTDYLLPFMQLAQDQLEIEMLQNPELQALTSIVVLPNIPALTTNLSAYFSAGGELELLTEVMSMKERSINGNRNDLDYNYV